MRWGTIAVGIVVAYVGTDRVYNVAWALPLVAYAAFRTWRPLRYATNRVSGLVAVLTEVGINLTVVVATGLWTSPYVFCLAAAIIAAGLARGFGFAIRTAGTAVLAIAIPFHWWVRPAPFLTTLQWGGELLLIALLAGYARRIFTAAEEQSLLAQQANDLLSQLYLVAQTLPASLDLGETVTAIISELRDRVPGDVFVILLASDDGGAAWEVVRAIGLRLPSVLTRADLPPPLARLAGGATALAADVSAGNGLDPEAWQGIYAPLDARGRRIGLIAVESREGIRLGARELPLVEGVARQAALALDNARWFSRLRTVGADEERTRIARDLHDRVGQALAFVAFELDRISRLSTGLPVEDELRQLREGVRQVITEVRDTLYDLRTDVTEKADLASTLKEFAERVSMREGIIIRCSVDATDRLPLPQEREFWRIAQEAITNATRHADAQHIDVRWKSTSRSGLLEVADDGKGLPAGVGSPGSYGLVGMRERAAAIGAGIEIESSPGGGTLIRCRLDQNGRQP